MIRLTIEMRFSTSRQRKTVAWFVPGETPREWLDEVTRWNCPLASLRLWIVPRGAADRRPCGVLVTDLTADVTGSGVLGAAVPYGCLVGKLFVPVEATFLPQLDDPDWRTLLPSEGESQERCICIWHPAAGFVAFEDSQCVRVADLLQAPARRAADWNQARPGIEFHSRLTAVLPLTPPTLAAVLEDGRSDIGSRGDDWSALPPSRNEPSDNPLAKLGGKLALGAAAAGSAVTNAVGAAAAAIGKGLRALTSGAASSSPAAGAARSGGQQPARSAWSLAWERMTQQWVERMRRSLEPARQKALRRLMELLEKNPDEGLKFALPFGGEGHRGLAPPSDQLAERPVNFDLNRLSGGPGDRWDVPAEMQTRLTTRYRELANREMQLGRHRRAAYIFGHLLNDFAAAANTLAAGKHWREAAVLYRDKLGHPLEAAHCLERGGLLTEAIELYEELKQFEKAGDLHARLEQHDEARSAWRRAAQQLSESNDCLAAAKIIESKLQEPDVALAQLDQGWTHSIQTEACLAESFRLLARQGLHSETSRRITHWCDADPLFTAWISPPLLVQQLASLVKSYPDADVRHLASDSARVLTVRHWESHNAADRERLLQSITALAPEDRLLARDTQRFASLARQPDPKKLPTPKPTPNSKQLLRLVQKWTLPGNIVWQAATCSQKHWFAVGMCGVTQVVARGDWQHSRSLSAIQLPNAGEACGEPLMFSAAPQDDGPVVVLNAGGKRKVISNWDVVGTKLNDDPLQNWLAPDTVGLFRQPGKVWVLRETPSGFVIEVLTEPGGLLLHTEQLHKALHEPWEVGLHPFYADPAQHLFIADGSTLHLSHYDGGWTSDRGRIQSLAGMTFERVTRLVLTLPAGGEVLWDDGREVRSSRLSDDYTNPVATFTRRGHLVVADSSTCDVFNADRGELRFRARGPELTSRPVAVLPAPHLDQFVLVTADGQVRLLEIPRP